MSAVPSNPGEAKELLSSLRDRVSDLEAWREGISAWKTSTNERLERLERENDRLHEENEELRERVDDLERIAEQAMVVASSGHDPDSRTKVEVALHLTRNELVRRAAMGNPSNDRPLTIATVQDKAEPEHVLKWQTVRDAFDNLNEEWPEFRETTKNGQQALTINARDIPKSLARAVEKDLGRDDLAKRLVGGNSDGGGSA